MLCNVPELGSRSDRINRLICVWICALVLLYVPPTFSSLSTGKPIQCYNTQYIFRLAFGQSLLFSIYYYFIIRDIGQNQTSTALAFWDFR
jgi:hypothetical protein